jgi:hypothetical protein
MSDVMSVGYRDDPLPKPAPWRCDTCRYWIAPDPPLLWGDCQRISECVDISKPIDFHLWLDPAIVPGCDGEEENPPLRNLQTVATFFCALYDPKREPLPFPAHGSRFFPGGCVLYTDSMLGYTER